MLIKIAGTSLGLILMILGGMLAAQEIALFSARDIARRANARGGVLRSAQIAGAIRRLDLVRERRHDVYLTKLGLEFALHKKVAAGIGRSPPYLAGQARLETFARQLAASAPLSGQAWCLLAELSARSKGFGVEAERFLHRCYKTAPKELWLIERRLHLAMALWSVLGKELKARATSDIFLIVRGVEPLHWPAGVLGYAAGVIAPQNAGMIREIISTNRPALLKRYDREVRFHRRQAAAAKTR